MPSPPGLTGLCLIFSFIMVNFLETKQKPKWVPINTNFWRDIVQRTTTYAVWLTPEISETVVLFCSICVMLFFACFLYLLFIVFSCYHCLCVQKKHPLLFSCITLRKSNQFEWKMKISDKIANAVLILT